METYGSVCGVWLPCSVQGVWGKRAPPFGNKWHDNEPDKVWEKSHWHISRKKGPKEDSEFDYNVPPHQNSNPSDEVKKKKKKTSSYFILSFYWQKTPVQPFPLSSQPMSLTVIAWIEYHKLSPLIHVRKRCYCKGIKQTKLNRHNTNEKHYTLDPIRIQPGTQLQITPPKNGQKHCVILQFNINL